MPTLEVTIDRIKLLLQQNGLDLNAVPLGALKQAIYNTSTSTELRAIHKKIQMLRELGRIKEVQQGVWQVG